jgi:immune inhibitor A
MKRPWFLPVSILAVLLIVICCICLALAAGASFFLISPSGPVISNPGLSYSTPDHTPVVIRPTTAPATPSVSITSLPGATITPEPTLSVASPTTGTLKTLNDTIIPENNLPDLARRLEGKDNIPPTVPAPATPLQVGDQQTFWASNTDTNDNFKVQATLRYITDHTYFWIQNDVSYSPKALKALADTFENKIYPTDREFFGSEWTPGVDDDPHLYILYARGLGSRVAGYFSSIDEYNPLIQQYSNGHEMFLFNADNVSLGEEFTYGVLAHEFQHMIHWYRDRNEETWMNEGFSDLAMFLNGYTIGGHDGLFVRNPDLQLNDWPNDQSKTAPHYGASFLFLTYFLDRFGENATKALVADPENGMSSIDDVLSQSGITDPQTGKPIKADDVFSDWVVASYLKDGNVADGRYTYHNYPTAPQPSDTEDFSTCPLAMTTRSVRQYGTDYIGIQCNGDYNLHFEGSVQVGVIPANAHSGSYAFWSNKGDESDMTLTHTFDFTNQSGPLSFSYWTWYDVEKDFDYVYLEASTDGQNWQILHTPSGTSANPTGANYGWAYNATSGSNNNKNPRWIQETVDLSQFSGKKVQLRFEYITDAAVNGEGFLLDDVSIPQINYSADFEQNDGGWQAKGFVRIKNALPQTFRLSLITLGSQTTVQHLALPADNAIDIPLHFDRSVRKAVLVVSGTTRFTRQTAAYRFQITP